MWIALALLAAVAARFAWRFFGTGEQLRSLEAAVAAIPHQQLYAANIAALGKALEHLCELPEPNEKRAVVHLEMALACLGRLETLDGHEGGAAFRLNARPLLVMMLRQQAQYYGVAVRTGTAHAEELIARALAVIAGSLGGGGTTSSR